MILTRMPSDRLREQGYSSVYGYGVTGRALIDRLKKLRVPIMIPSDAGEGHFFVQKWVTDLVVGWPLEEIDDAGSILLERSIRMGLVNKTPEEFAAALVAIARLGGVNGVRTFLGDRLEEELLDALLDLGVKPVWKP